MPLQFLALTRLAFRLRPFLADPFAFEFTFEVAFAFGGTFAFELAFAFFAFGAGAFFPELSESFVAFCALPFDQGRFFVGASRAGRCCCGGR